MRVALLIFTVSVFSYSITLDQAIDLALKKSPLIKEAKIKSSISKIQKELKKSQSFGSVELFSSYTHYNIPRTLKPLVPPIEPNITTSKDITSLGAKYSVALFKGFADRADIEAAKISAQKTLLATKYTTSKLIFTIKKLYFNSLAVKSLIQAQKKRIKALKSLEEHLRLSVKVGKKAPLDLLKTKEELSKATYNLERLQNLLNIQKTYLAAAIGVDRVDNLEDTKEIIKDIPKKLLSIELAKKEVIKSKKLLKKTKSLLYPKIFLENEYIKNYAKSKEALVWQSSLRLNYTLFDFGARKSKIEMAKLSTIMAKNSLAKTKLDLNAKIEATKKEIQTYKSKLNYLQKKIELAKEILKTEQIKYEEEAGTIDDVLRAMANYYYAKAEKKESLYQLYIKYAYHNFLTERP